MNADSNSRLKAIGSSTPSGTRRRSTVSPGIRRASSTRCRAASLTPTQTSFRTRVTEADSPYFLRDSEGRARLGCGLLCFKGLLRDDAGPSLHLGEEGTIGDRDVRLRTRRRDDVISSGPALGGWL